MALMECHVHRQPINCWHRNWRNSVYPWIWSCQVIAIDSFWRIWANPFSFNNHQSVDHPRRRNSEHTYLDKQHGDRRETAVSNRDENPICSKNNESKWDSSPFLFVFGLSSSAHSIDTNETCRCSVLILYFCRSLAI